MIKYRTGYSNEIKRIEIDRETENSVWYLGRRHSKRSSYENYFDSWQDAHSFLTAHAAAQVVSLRKQLERANGYMGNIRGMKEPV